MLHFWSTGVDSSEFFVFSQIPDKITKTTLPPVKKKTTTIITKRQQEQENKTKQKHMSLLQAS